MKAFLFVALALFAMASINTVQAAPNNPGGVQVVDLPSNAAAGSGPAPSYQTPSIQPEYVQPQPCDPSDPRCFQRPGGRPDDIVNIGPDGLSQYADPFLRGSK